MRIIGKIAALGLVVCFVGIAAGAEIGSDSINRHFYSPWCHLHCGSYHYVGAMNVFRRQFCDKLEGKFIQNLKDLKIASSDCPPGLLRLALRSEDFCEPRNSSLPTSLVKKFCDFRLSGVAVNESDSDTTPEKARSCRSYFSITTQDFWMILYYVGMALTGVFIGCWCIDCVCERNSKPSPVSKV